MAKVKYCPYCGSTDLIFDKEPIWTWITCNKCKRTFTVEEPA